MNDITDFAAGFRERIGNPLPDSVKSLAKTAALLPGLDARLETMDKRLEEMNKQFAEVNQHLAVVSPALLSFAKELKRIAPALDVTAPALEATAPALQVAAPAIESLVTTVADLRDAVDVLAATVLPLQGTAERVGHMIDRLPNRRRRRALKEAAALDHAAPDESAIPAEP
jgi:septal ring factor EnvC (AmiA/AmiB activator)